jgi:hypothetical protein
MRIPSQQEVPEARPTETLHQDVCREIELFSFRLSDPPRDLISKPPCRAAVRPSPIQQ